MLKGVHQKVEYIYMNSEQLDQRICYSSLVEVYLEACKIYGQSKNVLLLGLKLEWHLSITIKESFNFQG